MQETLAFVGGGQMAGALIGGLLASGHAAAKVRVAEPNAERAAWLRREFGVDVRAAAPEIAQGAGIVVLAVKPQAMSEALRGLSLGAGTTVVSIAAGVRIAGLRRSLGDAVRIVRTMPNTPAQLRCGIAGMFAGPEVPPAARAQAETVMKAVGETVWVEREELLDAVTALSGSGPAYFFLLTEVLRQAGAALGLDAATAAKLAQRTFIGAARMAESSGLDVSQLRANVTSKGGTTEAALRSLEAAGVQRIFDEALAAADRRGRELGDLLSRQS
ncbi:MAG: pyrroline-5-carboxylate reductase [Gammaproteobacteria bacterium]|nr:pyrroline-5-carboxylate reductase [Gammaproteobacteria bacterium]